ncbi:perlucin-like [Haliotis rubra]|uniref:perlucin-like n=1 Tax=Haliotis rubra TaxID=36100 RepID=UPI001EE5ED53|nr:perlucin-like [Haliotis rubra]
MMWQGGILGWFVLFSLCSVCLDAEGISCPADFHEVSGSCYWYSDTKASFKDATVQCRKMSSRLVVVASPEETALLHSNILLQGKADVYYIGARYQDNNRLWISDGNKPTTTPTTRSTTDLKCVVMRVQQRVRWYNADCNDKIRFICQFQ